MTYVMSDLHGDFEKYTAMLEKINFNEEDTLYVLGNVIDYGENGMKILLDMSSRPNVYPVIGEHEYTALPLLGKLLGKLGEKAVAQFDEKTMQSFAKWGKNGGQETVKEFRALSDDDRDWIIEYIEEFAPYEEVSVSGNEFILVHAGLDNFSSDREMEDYGLKELICGMPAYDRVYFQDKYLVTGHTPTVEISPAYKGKIFSLNHHIALNCGSQFGLPLGCIRLDDFAEFYVE